MAASDSALDFGAMPWGKHKILPITIVNRGYALVPIRLFASTVSIQLFGSLRPVNLCKL